MPTNPSKPAAKPAAQSGNTPATPAESKADKFKRIAGKRTNDVIRALDNLSNTANKNTYEWTPEQAEKIVTTLRERVDALAKAYAGESKSGGGFSL